MCVILDIKPGATIPQEMLEIACDINKHGYGIAYLEDSDIKITRSVKQPNDPVEIAEHLNALRNKRRYVHLRHATVGAVTMQNNHPLVVLTNKKKKKKITTLCMMHNGTLSAYETRKDKGVSDTAVFNEEFVRPLAMRSEALLGSREVVKDQFFIDMMLKEIRSMSVVLVFDNLGHHVIFNRSRGKDYTEHGFWASNEYSFNKLHGRSSVWATSGGFAGMDQRWRGHDPHSSGSLSRAMNDDFSGVQLPWREDRTPQDLGAEAWILTMTGEKRGQFQPPASSMGTVTGASGSSSGLSSAFLPGPNLTDRARINKEIVAAGALITKKVSEKTRRM